MLAEAQATVQGELEALTTERDDLRRELDRHHRELRRLAADGAAAAEAAERMASLHEQIADAERRLAELEVQIGERNRETIIRSEAEAAFADFDGIWQNLIPREQARLLRLLISVVEYDADSGSISVTFRPTSIRALLNRQLEQAA